jgi:hypothetical protein
MQAHASESASVRECGLSAARRAGLLVTHRALTWKMTRLCYACESLRDAIECSRSRL